MRANKGTYLRWTLACLVFVAIAPATAFAVDWNRAISASGTHIEPTSYGFCVGGPTPGRGCDVDADCGAGGVCARSCTVYNVCPGLEIHTFTAAAAGQNLGTRITVTASGGTPHVGDFPATANIFVPNTCYTNCGPNDCVPPSGATVDSCRHLPPSGGCGCLFFRIPGSFSEPLARPGCTLVKLDPTQGVDITAGPMPGSVAEQYTQDDTATVHVVGGVPALSRWGSVIMIVLVIVGTVSLIMYRRTATAA